MVKQTVNAERIKIYLKENFNILRVMRNIVPVTQEQNAIYKKI